VFAASRGAARDGGNEPLYDAPAVPAAREAQTDKGKKTRQAITITVSIGVAERNHRNSSPDQVVQAADKALYRAKEAGRNRVST